MKKLPLPFNVSLLEITKDKISHLRPTTSLDINEGSTKNFHPDGLFSTITFGRVGEERRDTSFSYIQLRVEVFHPIIYKCITTLKELYSEIINGRTYAIWNPKTKDFDKSDELQGETGYSFFLQHWKDIRYKETDSFARQNKIKLIEKYKDIALTKYILVMPAGLRDIEVTDNGRMQEHEINELYRRIISTNNVIASSTLNLNNKTLDQSRKTIQHTFNDIFDSITQMLSGKKGFIQKKWASRNLFYGTRNVITAMATAAEDLEAPNAVGLNNCLVGIYQLSKSIEPISKHLIKNGFISRAFGALSGNARLTNAKTLRSEYVPVTPQIYDRYNTEEGISKILTSLEDTELRNLPIKINDYYLGLIYKGPDMTFRFLSGIDELPDGFDKAYVEPITLIQLVYLSGYTEWNKYPAFITRYPVTGLGSIFPCYPYVKTTATSEVRKELGEDWLPLGDDYVAYEFPITTCNSFVDTLSPHPSRLALLGGDFDGDVCSMNSVFVQESLDEVKKLLGKASTYLNSGGGFKTSAGIDTVNLALHNMTSR